MYRFFDFVLFMELSELAESPALFCQIVFLHLKRALFPNTAFLNGFLLFLVRNAFTSAAERFRQHVGASSHSAGNRFPKDPASPQYLWDTPLDAPLDTPSVIAAFLKQLDNLKT
jgi:hypothetical protein